MGELTANELCYIFSYKEDDSYHVHDANKKQE